MRIRLANSLDMNRLREILVLQGFDYELPDVRTMLAAHVLEADGQVIQSILARPTAEMFFLADPNWRTPAWRLEAFRKIHESIRCDVNGKGIEDVHCWLPPQIAESFGNRLVDDFSWIKSPWDCYERPTRAKL